MKNNHVPIKRLYDRTISGDGFQATLSRNRFVFISSSLQFHDSQTREERRKMDKFALLSEIWHILIDKCKNNYQPSSYLTIEGQLVGFRRKCPFPMYIPSKLNKYGFKIILLCDQTTRYLINAIAYLGKASTPRNVPAAVYFTKPVYGTNRNITGDNWFSGIPLAIDLLKNHQLTYIGTIKKNKREFPLEFIDKKYKDRKFGTSERRFSYSEKT